MYHVDNNEWLNVNALTLAWRLGINVPIQAGSFKHSLFVVDVIIPSSVSKNTKK